MKKNTFTLIFAFLFAFGFAGFNQVQAQSDDYGYTAENVGPCDWIDISTIGTEVEGLADDNFVGPFDFGFGFQFYWTTQSEFYIGSNGYVSFNGFNLSSGAIGFPNSPTADATNDYVAPLVADLTFAGANNPGKVYYYTNNTDSLVVSFEEAPFWTDNATQSDGSNSFQVVFAAADSSITFNYLELETAVAAEYAASQNPVIVGIENNTGEIGIEITNMLPSAGDCFRFDPPNVPLIEVLDALPEWNQNSDNGGFFLMEGDIAEMKSSIKNAGSVNIDTEISVSSTVLREDGSVFDNYSATVPTLAQGESADAIFELFPAIESGTFTFRVQTDVADDINPGNDINESELIVATTNENDETALDYVSDLLGGVAAVINWTGAGGFDDGAGVYIEPPYYPARIVGAEFYVLPSAADPTITNGFRAEVVAADGANGTPGTTLTQEDKPLADILPAAWNRVDFSTPVDVMEGGVYLAWLQEDGGISLGGENTAPFSRRCYEILGGTWAPYRQFSTTDVHIRMIVAPTPVGLEDDLIQANSAIKFNAAYPNPVNNIAFLPVELSNAGDLSLRVYNTVGQLVHQKSYSSLPSGSQTLKLGTSTFAEGIYMLELSSNDEKVTQRLIVNH